MATPYDSTNTELLVEIIFQAEKRLQAQLDLAKAGDQRAMTFSGLLFAGVAVLFRLGIEQHVTTVGVEPLCVIFGFLIAAALAGASAWPIDWNSLGNEPKSYLNDIAAKKTLEDVRPETAAYLQEMIEENERVLQRNGRLMRASMLVALGAGFAGLFAAVI